MVDCRDAGPRVVRWTVERDGTRDEHTASLSVTEFERVWEKIDGSGWRYLKDCDGTGQDGDPIYNFDVTDWNGTGTFAGTYKNRRSLIFVGANDGMIHAIDARTGYEVWAFIPYNLLPKLRALNDGQPVEQFDYFVDSSPKLAEVKIG